MKIIDLIQNITLVKCRAICFRRIRTLEAMIKKAIADQNTIGTFEPIKYGIMTTNDSEIVFISTTELQELYGMKPMESLLFIDSIIKADSKKDKAQLINLLQSLTEGRHIKGPVVTPEMLENVKKNQPEVWMRYQELNEKIEKEEESAIQEMNQNINEEL